MLVSLTILHCQILSLFVIIKNTLARASLVDYLQNMVSQVSHQLHLNGGTVIKINRPKHHHIKYFHIFVIYVYYNRQAMLQFILVICNIPNVLQGRNLVVLTLATCKIHTST